MREDLRAIALGEGLVNLVVGVVAPVKGLRVEFADGEIRLGAQMPLVGRVRVSLEPVGVDWPGGKKLLFRIKEGARMVKMLGPFVRDTVRVEGDRVEISVAKWWDKLPEPLRFGVKVSRLRAEPGRLLVFLERA